MVDVIKSTVNLMGAFRFASNALKEYRIFEYKEQDHIITETLPTKNAYTIKIQAIKYDVINNLPIFDGEEIEIHILDFLDNAVETDFII